MYYPISVSVVPLINKGDELYLVIVGEVDISNEADFKRKLREQLEGSDNPVVLDFSNLSYFSAAGVTALVQMRKSCPDRKISIRGCSEKVRKILDLCKLDQIFELI